MVVAALSLETLARRYVAAALCHVLLRVVQAQCRKSLLRASCAIGMRQGVWVEKLNPTPSARPPQHHLQCGLGHRMAVPRQ